MNLLIGPGVCVYNAGIAQPEGRNGMTPLTDEETVRAAVIRMERIARRSNPTDARVLREAALLITALESERDAARRESHEWATVG